MNWEALGTFAEIISAAAVLITLIYLSIQTRMTRIAAEDTSKHATQDATNAAVEMYSRWRSMALNGADVAEILSRAKEGQDLSQKESIVLNAYFEELFFVSAVAYRSALHEASGHVAPNDAMHLAYVLEQYPSAKENWQRMKAFVANVSAELVQEVDKLLEENISKLDV